jgi:general secretion pathway protein J
MYRTEERGFTLLELVVAMTLLGFILVLLFGGLRLGSQSWDAAEQRLAAASQLGVAQDFVRRELSQIYPLRWKPLPEQPVAFVGEPHAIRFAGPVPSRLGLSGINFIVLEAAQVDDEQQLVMRSGPPKPDAQDFSQLEDADKVVLAEDVDEVTFSYFGAEDEEAEPTWREEWLQPQKLPTLIRLRLTLKDGTQWPEIVVAPMISTEAACLWDDFFKRCVDR